MTLKGRGVKTIVVVRIRLICSPDPSHCWSIFGSQFMFVWNNAIRLLDCWPGQIWPWNMIVLGTNMKCEIHQKDEDMIGVPESISMSSKNHDGSESAWHRQHGDKKMQSVNDLLNLNLHSAAWVCFGFFEIQTTFNLQSTKRKRLHSKYSPACAEHTLKITSVSTARCSSNQQVTIWEKFLIYAIRLLHLIKSSLEQYVDILEHVLVSQLAYLFV